jgi:hypothetical protein
MSRSDTELLEYVLCFFTVGADHQLLDENLCDERGEAIQAAIECGLSGRVALAAAVNAVRLEPGEHLPDWIEPTLGPHWLAVHPDMPGTLQWQTTIEGFRHLLNTGSRALSPEIEADVAQAATMGFKPRG